MIKILGISGSLRAQSYNTALLKVAKSLASDDVELEIATLHGIPLYDGDLEHREGIPAAVKALKDRILANDGVLLSTPEYNNGIPGVFKNAIDWMSRTPPQQSEHFHQLAGCSDRCVARRLRHHSFAKRLASGFENTRHAALGRRPIDAVAGTHLD